MVLNSLNSCLSVNLLIFHQLLMRSLLGVVILVVDFFFSFNTLNISCHSLLACSVSAKGFTVNHIDFSLYVTCSFFLAAFNILSLCLISVSLINVPSCVSPWIYPVRDFALLGLDCLFPFPCWGSFQL